MALIFTFYRSKNLRQHVYSHLGLQQISLSGDEKKSGALFWCSDLITSMTENTLSAAATGEEIISKIVEDTVITTEDNCIVIYDSGFSQGGEESTSITSALNFDERDRPERTKGAITNNNPVPRKLNLSRMFEFEPMFEKWSQQ